jgi:hypothetical protein
MVPIALDLLAIDIPLTAQLLVAAGTLGLASATAWLAWNSQKERKTSNARELAIGVYNPLRNDIFRWIESEPSYSDQLGETWTSLKRTQLHLVAGVPKSITTQLDAVEPDVRKVNFLKDQVTNSVRELTTRLAGDANAQSIVLIRLIVSRGFVRAIDPTIVWLSRKSLANYVNEYVTRQYPGDTWGLEFAVTGNSTKGTKEAEEYCNRFFEELDRNKNANDLRDLLEKIRVQGKAINALIEVELKKH